MCRRQCIPVGQQQLRCIRTSRGVTMMNFRKVQFSLALNGLGAILLLFAFQATSTDVMLVTDKAKSKAAFCIGNRAMFVVEGQGIGFGTTCPESSTMKPTAVVNSEHPTL